MSESISLSNLASSLRKHAEHCTAAIQYADDRAEHIRLTQIALEATRLALNLELWISQNTEVGTGPVDTLPLAPTV